MALRMPPGASAFQTSPNPPCPRRSRSLYPAMGSAWLTTRNAILNSSHISDASGGKVSVKYKQARRADFEALRQGFGSLAFKGSDSLVQSLVVLRSTLVLSCRS